MNVKFKDNLSFEVQIECKKDNNLDIINALKTQLIDKYFSSEAKYGIYLIFNFSKTLKKDEMLNQFKALIPDEYIDNIKVIFMDMFL